MAVINDTYPGEAEVPLPVILKPQWQIYECRPFFSNLIQGIAMEHVGAE